MASAVDRAGWFLENACPDHHVRGGPDHLMARATAMRLLDRHPEIARASLYTAVVCGELTEVERILAARPAAASDKGPAASAERAGVGGSGDRFRRDLGPKGWEPLLYLCFARLPLPSASEHAVAIARALLDRGADPNAYFVAGGCRYTPLVGVIGEGEENRPPHPQREALAQLLLERGAEPYDIQVLYNIHFRGDVLWWLKRIHAQAVRSGRQADWQDPTWPMLDMGPYGCGARYLLGLAVQRNDLELAEWLLAHGASPNAPPAPSARRPPWTRPLHEEALRNGLTEMAGLLLRHGATPASIVLEGEDAFTAACLRLDREEARRLFTGHPEYLRSPRAMHAAAERDRVDVSAFLLDLGVSADVQDPEAGNQGPLHVAAYQDSCRVAALLVERGATVDHCDSVHDATPLWFAIWAGRTRAIELLSRWSRDVWALTFTGNVERLREVLAAEPRLARLAGETTPLMWLPGDEARALQIVELLLAHGADPTRRNSDGLTAADLAEARGLDGAAERLRG
jgi:hypothetical protein